MEPLPEAAPPGGAYPQQYPTTFKGQAPTRQPSASAAASPFTSLVGPAQLFAADSASNAALPTALPGGALSPFLGTPSVTPGGYGGAKSFP